MCSARNDEGSAVHPLTEILIAVGLVMATVSTHVVGFAALLRGLVTWHVLTISGLWRITWLMTALTCWLIIVHLIEISIWGLFYLWQGCMPDAESAFYFSGATYTTVGYGDLVLPKPWRMLAPLQALTGILMCGLSIALFFTIVGRWIRNWTRRQALTDRRSLAPKND